MVQYYAHTVYIHTHVYTLHAHVVYTIGVIFILSIYFWVIYNGHIYYCTNYIYIHVHVHIHVHAIVCTDVHRFHEYSHAHTMCGLGFLPFFYFYGHLRCVVCLFTYVPKYYSSVSVVGGDYIILCCTVLYCIYMNTVIVNMQLSVVCTNKNGAM